MCIRDSRNYQHAHEPGALVGAVQHRSRCLRSTQGGLCRAFAARRRAGSPQPALGRRSGAAGNARDLPTFYPAGLGLGRRLSTDQPFPGLGTAPRRRPVDGRRQHFPRPIDRCCGIGRATGRRCHSGLRRRHHRPYFARIDHGGTIRRTNSLRVSSTISEVSPQFVRATLGVALEGLSLIHISEPTRPY